MLRFHLGFIAAICAVSLIGAQVTSRVYWGHLGNPPSSEATVAPLASADRYEFTWSPAGSRDAVNLFNMAAQENWTPGDTPIGRLPAAVLRHGLRPEAGRLEGEPLSAAIAVLESLGLLRAGTAGYGHAKDLRGLLVSGTSRSGERLLAVGLTGGELSNDHYPYYEALFRVGAEGSLRPISWMHYRYDAAGVEGFGHIAGGVLTFAVGVVLYLASSLVLVWRHARRARVA
jgi:hypothetical protein